MSVFGHLCVWVTTDFFLFDSARNNNKPVLHIDYSVDLFTVYQNGFPPFSLIRSQYTNYVHLFAVAINNLWSTASLDFNCASSISHILNLGSMVHPLNDKQTADRLQLFSVWHSSLFINIIKPYKIVLGFEFHFAICSVSKSNSRVLPFPGPNIIYW